MGFLHKLWDETLAGPMPENGLRRLRNHISGENGHRKLIVNLSRVPDSPTRSSDPASPLTCKLFCFFMIQCLSSMLVFPIHVKDFQGDIYLHSHKKLESYRFVN